MKRRSNSRKIFYRLVKDVDSNEVSKEEETKETSKQS